VPITVKTVDAGLAESLRWHLAPFARPKLEFDSVPVWIYVEEEDQERPGRPYSYFRDEVVQRKESSLAALFEYIRWDLHAFIPQRARDYLLLHAGAVTADGAAMLLAGPPEAGKSSLVLALLQRGFNYLSDDLGPIDPVTSRIYPFQKRISVRHSTLLRYFPGVESRLEDRTGLSSELRERFVRPEDVDASVGAPSPARWIVFLGENRQGPPRLEPLTRATAVERMATYSFNLFRFKDRGIVLLSRVAADAEAFLLDGGTAPERAELIADRLSPG
jgi:hypothetical protein